MVALEPTRLPTLYVNWTSRVIAASIGLAFIVPPLLWAMSRREQTTAQGTACLKCGYDLRGLGSSGTCPECGKAYVPTQIIRDRVTWDRSLIAWVAGIQVLASILGAAGMVAGVTIRYSLRRPWAQAWSETFAANFRFDSLTLATDSAWFATAAFLVATRLVRRTNRLRLAFAVVGIHVIACGLVTWGDYRVLFAVANNVPRIQSTLLGICSGACALLLTLWLDLLLSGRQPARESPPRA